MWCQCEHTSNAIYLAPSCQGAFVMLTNFPLKTVLFWGRRGGNLNLQHWICQHVSKREYCLGMEQKRVISDHGPQMKYCGHNKQQYQTISPPEPRRSFLPVPSFVRYQSKGEMGSRSMVMFTGAFIQVWWSKRATARSSCMCSQIKSRRQLVNTFPFT